jgi:hypothetical protein
MDEIFKFLAALGGVGVVVIALSKFIGDVLRNRLKEKDRLSSELLLEAARQNYGIRRVQTDKFAESHYEVYLQLWETLQALRLTVDALWHKVTKQNLSTLLRQLRTTEQRVYDWEIFFEPEHFSELRRLLEIIKSFRTGKLVLEEIRTKKDLDYVNVEDIKGQVEQNQQYRDQLEQLLEALKRDFRDRLSSVNSVDVI